MSLLKFIAKVPADVTFDIQNITNIVIIKFT